MEASQNPKSAAWDQFGPGYWDLTSPASKPSKHEIDLLLREAEPGARCSIIGASTRDLINTAVERGLEVTVLDFSKGMCQSLSNWIGPQACRVHCHDILREAPRDLRDSQDLVLSDRLVNRLTSDETAKALRVMANMLVTGGQIRASVRTGLFRTDIALIEEGRRRGTLADFYDERTKTINWGKSGDILEECAPDYGSVPREIALEWYRQRGDESRYDRSDIVGIFDGIGELQLIGEERFPQAPSTLLFYIVRV